MKNKYCHNKHHLIDQLYCNFCQILGSVLHFFDIEGDGHHSNDKNQSGELMVSGSSEITIPLKSHPDYIRVIFKEVCNIVPCNPHHHDHLEWEVISEDHHDHHQDHGAHGHKHELKYSLHIKYEVSGVRDIIWVACY